MKRFKIVSLLMVIAILAAACASPNATTTSAGGQPAEEATAPSETAVAPAEAATEPPEPVAEPTEIVEEPTEAPAEPESGEKKVATFIFTQEFDTLNPLYSNMWFSAITRQLWDVWAWEFDDENNPIPVLLTEMPSVENGGISEDGTVITFKLRDDITWSDGTPITSADFKFTYEMTIDPANAVATISPYDLIQSLETPDDQTVVIAFGEPYAPWVGTLWHSLLPMHILQPVYDADGTLDNAEWNRNPTVGAGPFLFAEWETGSYARFVANEDYWLGRPKLDEIFIRFVPDDAAQIAALTGGEGDLGTFFSNSDVPTLEDAGVAVYRVFSGYNEGLYFYQDPENGHPALQDVNVRQAIAYAIDKEAITRDLLLGLTQPAATLWDNTPFVDPELQAYPYDPAKAQELLDAAGWKDENGDGVREKDGVDLSLTYGTSTRSVRQDTQAVVQQQLAEVGIKVELLNYDSDIFFAGYAEGGPAAVGELDIFQYSNTPQYPDPDLYEFLCNEIPSDEKPAGVNSSALCDDELDALFQEQATLVDFAERQQTFYAISRMIFEKAYWVGLWQDPDLWGVNERLVNVRISGATPFFNIMEWDIQ